MDTAATPAPQTIIRSALTGWILLSMLPLSLLATLTDLLPGYVAGIPVWFTALILLRKQKRNQIVQSGILLTTGAIGLLAAFWLDGSTRYLFKALEANHMIIAMLIGVSFLRLVTLGELSQEERLPSGRNALWGTLFGGHIIGAVINISSVMILGDRLSAHRPLTSLQALTLLRSFSTCAAWSPFFAAMGVVLLSAPGSNLVVMMLSGLPFAFLAMLFSAVQIARHPESATTRGYPMHFKALWPPVVLAMLVMIAHKLWPNVSVLTLVTVIALLFSLVWLPLRYQGDSGEKLKGHIHEGLPRMSSEVLLFLSAAVLASGVGALLLALDIQLAPTHFGPLEACVTVAALVGLAFIGMHPVTSAVLAGSILMPSVEDPNLLGIALLLGWSLGVGLSPFSGVQISLQSRYGISARTLLRFNRYYGLAAFAIAFATLWIYGLLNPATLA
ncbi:hypothetical protein ADIMK_0209 [Marinobacterium lacunae]|uniref:Uncharacterized protein n=1 Tax=Marinobacterium lacunae TaxID=1232683 RepID=A0A081G4I2_9GAMM|nr:hypothetical protein [Marinobacterium lacunae]KEA65687.1 hypothetical protein ADIMK_0209 [Marinobacterium lacunae]